MPQSTKSPPAGKRRREAIIGGSKAAADPYRCPYCGHDHVIVEGKWQRRFEKEYRAGEEVGIVMQAADFTERYTAIVCKKCDTRTEIEPDHIVELLAENARLQMQAAGKRGVTVVKDAAAKVM